MGRGGGGRKDSGGGAPDPPPTPPASFSMEIKKIQKGPGRGEGQSSSTMGSEVLAG